MKKRMLAVAISLALGAQAAVAAEANQAPKVQQGNPDLERKIDVLTEEVEKLKSSMTLPEKTEMKSVYGLGPAASKVYGVSRGLSIGGYGEGYYQNLVSDKGTGANKADFLRLVTYIGYKFTDKLIFNSEIEFEHGSTGKGGEVSVEFAYLDYLFNPAFNVRAGMVLVPMGLINEYHEPVFFNSVLRPQVEQTVIPTTWSEIGAGAFGELAPGLTYKAYVLNGMNASGFSADGIRSGRQNGAQARAEDLAFVARLDYTPTLGLTVGGSVYTGNSGQNQVIAGQRPDARLNLYELHGVWQYRGLELKALGAVGNIGDANVLSTGKAVNAAVPERFYGWYTEAGYDVLPLLKKDSTQSLIPFVRYERYNTQDEVPAGFTPNRAKDIELWVAGVNYKPHPQVAIKADYRNFEPQAGTKADEVNLGVAFVF